MSLLPQLERELSAAELRLFAAHRAGRRFSFRDRGRGRRRPGAVVLAVGVTVALAVAVIGVVVSDRTASNRTPVNPARQSVSSTRQQLLRTIGVLREPASPADLKAIACAGAPPSPRSLRLPACQSLLDRTLVLSRLRQRSANGNPGGPPGSAGSGSARLDRALIRVVAVPRFHASVALLPQTWQPSPRSRHQTEGLELAVAQGRSVTTTGPPPTSVATMRAHGLATAGGNVTPQMRSVIGVVLVPDGVARVTLAPLRLISPPAPIDPRRFGTITTSVRNNVGAFRFKVPTASNPLTQSGVKYVHVVMRETWAGAHGDIIARTSIQIGLWLRVQGIGPINSTN